MRLTPPPRGLFAKGVDLSTFGSRLIATGTCGTLASTTQEIRIGQQAPSWRLEFGGDAETSRITQLTLATDYLEGRITAIGEQRDIVRVRHVLPYGINLKFGASLAAEFPLSLIAQHRRGLIEAHYDRPDEFFLTFLDHRHQLYSQGHFSDGLSSDLENASERKLEKIASEFRKVGATRILDVGCGWGGVTTFLAREFDVTALTLGRRSYEFTCARLDAAGLSATVELCDVLNFHTQSPFDGVVMLGVLEHNPNYRRLFGHVSRVTHPRSRIYIDCASSYSRFAINPFIRQRIWPGTHGFVDVPSMLAHAQNQGFAVVELTNETKDYAQTMTVWADRFVAQKQTIRRFVQEADYRAFEMYLFGGEEALRNGPLSAHHCVLDRSLGRGDQP